MIEVENMFFSYSKNSKEIINNLSFKINKGESVGIIGANGVGKSTILKLLVGLEFPSKGNIKINDKILKKETVIDIRKDVGYVFQDSDSQLFMPTIYDDVAFAPRNYGFSKDEVEKMTMDALKSVGIEKIKDTPIYHLSGGQKKLASIATVLSMKPEILIFDEPTVALDPKNRRMLINILNSLKNITKIIASHDLDMIYDSCSRTILISNGKIVKDDITENILNDKELLENNGLELPLSLQRRK